MVYAPRFNNAMANKSSSLPQDLVREIGVEDLYEFLGVNSASTEKEITRGYRKKALKCHPDKNPDNPKAADEFQKLSKAYIYLTDPAAKGAYDKWLKAKHAAKQRHDELTAKRRKLKETLESRESQFSAGGGSGEDEREAARRMQKEIERLREEGLRKVKEQEELLRRQLQTSPTTDDDLLPTLKVTWKVDKKEDSQGYNSDSLTEIFSKYGPVNHVLVSSKKRGKALVSFQHHTDTLCTLESGIGLPANPLKVVWVNGDPSSMRSVPRVSVPEPQQKLDDVYRGSDYESLTLMRLRQAEERKRLCQQLQEQDELS